MENLIRSTFGDWGYLIIPLVTGIFISFMAEALNRVTPKIINNHVILLLASGIGTFLVLMVFPSYFENDVWELVFAFFLNLFFAYVFYFTVGKRVVNLIVKRAGITIQDTVKEKLPEKKKEGE